MGTGPTKLVVVTTIKTTNSQYAATTRRTSSQHAGMTRAMGNTFTKLRAVTKIRTGNTTNASTPRDQSTMFTRVVNNEQGPEPLVHEADQETGHSKANCKLVKY